MKKICLFLLLTFCFSYMVKAQPGSLDPSFGNGGKKSIRFGDGNFANDWVQKALVQADGKIIMAVASNPGTMSFVSRLNSNGSIDQSYGDNGFSEPLPLVITDAALQADGKLLLTGKYQSGADYLFAVMRLTTTGALDNSFDGDGIASVLINPLPANYYARYEYAYAVMAQPDGKIVLAGNSFEHAVVVRLNSNGSPDNSFDGDGIAPVNFGQNFENLTSVALQSNGKLLVAGVTDQCTYCGSKNIVLARFNTDGSLDISFDGDGKVVTDISNYSDDLTKAMEIQPDGKIVIGAGTSINYNNYLALLRYNTDGSLDNSFDGDGKVLNNTFMSYSGYPNPILIQPNGKILMGFLYNANNYPTNSTDYALLRFNTDGSIDNTLNGNGMLNSNYAEFDNEVSLAMQSDGKVIFAGASQFYGTSGDFFVTLRYNSDLSPDNSYGQNGIASGYYPADITPITDITVQPDGKILGLGSHTLQNYNFEGLLVRLNPDGSYDNSLNGNGKLFFADGTPFAVCTQTDGKFLVAGEGYDINTGRYLFIRRYNPAGTPDNSFDGDGLLLVPTQQLMYGSRCMGIEPDGKIVLAAVENYYNYPAYINRFIVWKFNPDGTPDNGFDIDGKMNFTLGSDTYGNGITGNIAGIGFQPGNKIILGGNYYFGAYPDLDARFWTARINPGGSLDNTFDGDGIAYISHGNISNGDVSAGGLAVQTDGKIIIAGSQVNYSVYPGTGVFLLTRFTADGAADNSFDGDGIVVTNGPPQRSIGTSLAIQNDGKIIAGGYHYQGGAFFDELMITRYNSNGSLDNSFDGDGIVITGLGVLNAPAPSKLAIFNNRLYAGGSTGYFANSNGIIVSYILSEVLSCPPGKTVSTGTGLCNAVVTGIDPVGIPSAQVNYTLSGVTTGSGSGSASGKTFNKGVTTVTYTTITNPVQTCSFTVTVNDNENPVITCPANITQNTLPLLCNALVITPAPVKTDNCGVTQLTWTMSGATTGNSPATGINNVGIRLFNKGVTTITYTASDAAGNSSSCSFTVTVLDNQSPIMICPLNIIKSAQGNCSASVTVPNPLLLFDNCAVTTLTWSMTGATTGNSPATGMNYVGTRIFNVGITTVVYTAKDAASNSSSCSFTVRVNGPQNCNNNFLDPAEYTDGKMPLKDMNGRLDLKVYPNPSNDQFTLDLSSVSSEKIEITISDATGRMIKRSEMAPKNSIRFGQELKPGIYMIEVRQGLERKTVKIVKQ